MLGIGTEDGKDPFHCPESQPLCMPGTYENSGLSKVENVRPRL